MKSFSFKAALAALLLGLAPTQAHAIITPQKYCESLAATSCEVLNMDVSASNGYSANIIKYCKNRVLKFMPTGGQAHGDGQIIKFFYREQATAYMAYSNSYTLGLNNTNELSNTHLCSFLP